MAIHGEAARDPYECAGIDLETLRSIPALRE